MGGHEEFKVFLGFEIESEAKFGESNSLLKPTSYRKGLMLLLMRIIWHSSRPQLAFIP